MASRGSNKHRSVEQENFIAKKISGRRSPSSGASDKDPGDVRNEIFLIECKTTGEFDKPAKSISLKLGDLEKIADEAYAAGRVPVVALRIHNPNSPLADANGNVDIIANLLKDWLYLDRLY
jgi:Holliday junction resolvase